MLYFTSDLHFGHRNVINYCNRPFKTVEEMNAYIVDYWNKTVKKDDTIIVVGDFSLHPRYSQLYVPILNGHKILVSGNHDATFEKGKKYLKMIERYKQDGWASVHNKLQLTINGQTVLVTHFPYRSADGEKYDTRYLKFRELNKGLPLIHGHLHGKYRKFNSMIDVGFDGDLKFWSEPEIIQLLNDDRQFIPTPITEFYKTRTDGNEAD